MLQLKNRMSLAAASCTGFLIAAAWSAPALAQSATSFSLEAQTDHRQRGLGWSDGKAALGVSAAVPVADGLSFDLGAVTLRDSARHGGADLGLTLAPRYTVRSNGWELAAGVRGNVFVGRAGTSYGEITGHVARTLGPAQLSVGAAYAPPQDAIGGSNLYVDAQLAAGIPGTPLTLYGGLGHSSGTTRNDPRAARLRPGGDYLDHHVGAEFVDGTLTAGLRYSGTSIGAAEVDPAARWSDRHYGERVMAYVRFTP